jgi:uncharacterized protein (TIGR03086 family)
MTADADRCAARYRKVAGAFDDRVRAVPADAWDRPAPCEGWVARDVVGHLAEWMPSLFLAGAGLPVPDLPSSDVDPVGAWAALHGALLAVLEDPDRAALPLGMPMGEFLLAEAIDRFGTTDILVHTWDLARATGLDETLDPDEVHDAFAAMDPIADVLAGSGHYARRVPVPADADEQTKLIAVTGRDPAWRPPPHV